MARSDEEPILSITNSDCLIDGSDAAFRRLVNGLLPFAARLLSVRDGLGSLIGLTGIQYSLLVSVAHLSRGGVVTASRLADYLHLSDAFVTNEIGKLRKFGLVEKQSVQNDKRKMQLTITPAASRLLGTLTDPQQHIHNVLFEGVTKAEFMVLCSLVDRLVVNGDHATLDLNEHLAQF